MWESVRRKLENVGELLNGVHDHMSVDQQHRQKGRPLNQPSIAKMFAGRGGVNGGANGVADAGANDGPSAGTSGGANLGSGGGLNAGANGGVEARVSGTGREGEDRSASERVGAGVNVGTSGRVNTGVGLSEGIGAGTRMGGHGGGQTQKAKGPYQPRIAEAFRKSLGSDASGGSGPVRTGSIHTSQSRGSIVLGEASGQEEGGQCQAHNGTGAGPSLLDSRSENKLAASSFDRLTGDRLASSSVDNRSQEGAVPPLDKRDSLAAANSDRGSGDRLAASYADSQGSAGVQVDGPGIRRLRMESGLSQCSGRSSKQEGVGLQQCLGQSPGQATAGLADGIPLHEVLQRNYEEVATAMVGARPDLKRRRGEGDDPPSKVQRKA
jgi:hypothetical protein